MSAAVEQAITYADLRDGDTLVDKSGGHWHVSGVTAYTEPDNNGGHRATDFWLGDPVTKVRLHHLTKLAGDAVTVLRIPSHADDVADLEAQYPAMVVDGATLTQSKDDPWRTAELEESARVVEAEAHDAAVAEIEQQLAATVEADVTAEQVDEARQATDDDPVVVPTFESMTDLEQRSHLFVLHGVFAFDIEDRKTRSEVHTKAHRDAAEGKLNSKHRPHQHSAEVKS